MEVEKCQRTGLIEYGYCVVGVTSRDIKCTYSQLCAASHYNQLRILAIRDHNDLFFCPVLMSTHSGIVYTGAKSDFLVCLPPALAVIKVI